MNPDLNRSAKLLEIINYAKGILNFPKLMTRVSYDWVELNLKTVVNVQEY